MLRDQFSSQIGNSRLPWSRQARALIDAHHVAGRSRIVTSHATVSAVDAAFINATYAHGFEYDEGHRPSNSHPGSCVVATAVAVGEEVGATLDEVVTAVLMGYEVYARLGVLAAPDLIQRGSTRPACWPASARRRSRPGFAVSTPRPRCMRWPSRSAMPSGALECSSSGGSVKRVHPGIGVRGGMMAAQLAQAGITGPRAFLSGVRGFYKAFLQRGPAEDAAQRFAFDARFEIFRGGYKRYCCCGANHASVDILAAYAPQLGEIETVTLRIPKLVNGMVGLANAGVYTPGNIEQVQFSLPVQAAFALLGIGNGYGAHLGYLEGTVDMARVGTVARKVQLVEDAGLDQQYPGKFVTEATVRFVDGRIESRFVENSVGTPDNPMTDEVHDLKFMELAAPVLGEPRSRQLLDVLHRLPGDLPVSELTRLCAI